jgi:transposase
MPRKYTDIKQYENQIMEMRAAGKTRREIAQALGLEKEQIKGWITRFNREQRKLEAGIKPRPKGRPHKDAEPRDIVAEQAYEIERLKMENKLLRDFMRLAGRR